jgi:hypothetical protein
VIEDDEDIELDDDDIARMHQAEDEERLIRVKAACRQIKQGFWELRDVIGDEQAWRCLEWFVKQVKPPRRRKGRHWPARDQEILATYDDAPKGKKMAQVRALGQRYHVTPEAVIRHLRRLLAERKRFNATLLEILEKQARREREREHAGTRRG